MATKCTDLESIYADVPNCRGQKSLPGMKSEVYAVSKRDIVSYPSLPDNPASLEESAVYKGNFVLAADKKFFYVGLIDDKNQLQSENQGEEYSKTFKVTGTFDIPGTGKKAAGLVHQMNNDDMIFIAMSREGYARVIGNEQFHVKLTLSQDSGQAVTDANHTAVSAEVTDWAPAPFYEGLIPTADGDIDATTGQLTTKDV